MKNRIMGLRTKNRVNSKATRSGKENFLPEISNVLHCSYILFFTLNSISFHFYYLPSISVCWLYFIVWNSMITFLNLLHLFLFQILFELFSEWQIWSVVWSFEMLPLWNRAEELPGVQPRVWRSRCREPDGCRCLPLTHLLTQSFLPTDVLTPKILSLRLSIVADTVKSTNSFCKFWLHRIPKCFFQRVLMLKWPDRLICGCQLKLQTNNHIFRSTTTSFCKSSDLHDDIHDDLDFRHWT